MSIARLKGTGNVFIWEKGEGVSEINIDGCCFQAKDCSLSLFAYGSGWLALRGKGRGGGASAIEAGW